MHKFNLSKLSSPAQMINIVWPSFNKVPGGKHLFSKIVGKVIPYTGSVSPLVEQIENGAACVTLKDRRGVRNHLNSIHAIALANVGEFTTGLSVISQFTNKEQAILVKIEVEYLKKARGDVTAYASSQLPLSITQDTDVLVTSEIKNTKKEIVCKVHATWRIRP